MVTTVTGFCLAQNLPLIQQIEKVKTKLAKLIMACVLCLGIAFGLVWMIKNFTN
jgi:hypothetical protein